MPSPLTVAASLPLSESDAAPNVGTLKQHSYSQETRLASAVPDSPVKWVAGLFGAYSQQVETNNQYSVYGASVYSAALGTPVAPDANLQASDPTSSETQVAAFGQIDIELIDRLTASAGLRVASTQTKQTTSSVGAIYEYFGGIHALVSSGKTPWSLTASLEYDYDLFGKNNGYARAEDIFHSHNSGPYVTTVSPAILRADPSTNLLNLRFGGTWGHRDASLFLNNALNSSPRIGKFNLGSGIAYTYSTTFRPLTGGVSGSLIAAIFNVRWGNVLPLVAGILALGACAWILGAFDNVIVYVFAR